jgi:hypothetical protein
MRTMLAVLFLTVPAVACDKGCYPYEGICACDQRPDTSTVQGEEVQPSAEKPPDEKMPSYERPEVHADTPASEIAKDIAKDNEKKCATIAGKKKGHVPLTDDEKAFQDQCQK